MTSPNLPSRTPRRRRGLIAAGSAIGLAAVIGVGVVGASAAFADGSSPSPAPSTSASASAHSRAGLRPGPLRRELESAFRSNTDSATHAQKIATRLVGSAKLFAKFPTALQNDLTSLSHASGSDVATDVATLRNTALSGGYGADVQKVAQRIQSHASTSTATPTPAS